MTSLQDQVNLVQVPEDEPVWSRPRDILGRPGLRCCRLQGQLPQPYRANGATPRRPSLATGDELSSSEQRWK